MPFELFTKRSAGKLRKPTITVQKRGTLSLNASAAAILAGGEIPDRDVLVELLYDRDRKIIGIRRAPEEHPNSYPLRKQPKSDSYLLAGKAFCQFYGIETGGKSRRFIAKEYEDGILGAELEGDHAEVTREK